MKRSMIAVLFALLTVLGAAGARPAEAAPPGPQCGAVMPCDGPVERILRICQYAYCQFP